MPIAFPTRTPSKPLCAVVPEPRDHAAQRLGAVVEARDARVVLEAGQRPPHARLELALQQAVADHPPVARNRVERKEPGAGKLSAVPSTIEPAQELVPAAHGEHGRSAADRLSDRLAPRSEIRRDQRLLPILPAADVEQVVFARAQRRRPG